ncbi:helix-turn-helix domain-containing protein [Paenibacillus fonticola]|uniref:helix-turn-helix domain-containing protein n=1 Tax=Paenibacillus fonticola TaxID=379896 RepID=UPI000376CB9D|nr:helix-turn-helix domain-containing protein [Paenibacillus fonticola]
MKNNWYRRMLLSYFPIFLITITILVFLSFIIVNEISQKETVKADRISTEYIMNTVELSLKEIEMNVLEEVEHNERYESLLHLGFDRGKRETVYGVVGSLRTLISRDELIDSIYVYRSNSRQALTTSGVVEWSDFADQAFIEQVLEQPEYQGWSGIRTYHEMKTDKIRRVMSMYKRAPLPFGTQGFVVINVNMYALEQRIRNMIGDDLSFMNILDKSGNIVFSSSDYGSDAKADEARDKVLNRITSTLTGWTFESGISAGQLFVWVSVVSYIWIVLGLVTVLGAIAYILYITKRNYKPIRVMMNRIESIRDRMDNLSVPKADELLLIDRALENLIQQTSDYEKRQHENMLIARRQLFIDIIQGERLGKVNERLRELKPLPDEVLGGRYIVIVVEILDFSDFQNHFSVMDQSTLKFALTNVLQEIAREEGLHGWGEWTEVNRMGMIFALHSEKGKENDIIRKFADRGILWTREHLGMSLMVGVGPCSASWEELAASYQMAARALQHKMSLGKEAVIMSEDMPDNGSRLTYSHLQGIAHFVKQFRLSNEEWRSHLERIFEAMEADGLKDEDIRLLLQTMMEMLARELGELSERLLESFREEQAGRWRMEVENTESLEQLRLLFMEELSEIYRTYVAISETKNHRAMILEMKAYIEENFADPDLSLKHLSDRFDISGKYASYLFKEEFNMKFVDFLVQLRMAKAEQLLVETGETVQNIALQVGYANSITFGRTFKREVGVTPGDYRKLKIKPQRDMTIS